MADSVEFIKKLALGTGLQPAQLQKIIRTAPLRYKVFSIPKKSGGTRLVAQPAREVKAIQRWIVSEISPLIPIHQAATAYKEGSSIKNNAQVHAPNKFILKLDFKNFFPSIMLGDVFAHLTRHCGNGFSSDELKLIAWTCCWLKDRDSLPRLCIGAPTSPLISNSILYDFDVALAERAYANGINYTRYADDITLSSSVIDGLAEYIGIVNILLKDLPYPRLELNPEKTIFASRKGRRVVTGLVLTPTGGLSIGRERKRLIRAMHDRRLKGLLDEKQIRQLDGIVAFAEYIEPGFSLRLKKSVAD